MKDTKKNVFFIKNMQHNITSQIINGQIITKIAFAKLIGV